MSKLQVGKHYRYSGDNNRVYILEAIYGGESFAPGPGPLYIIRESGRIPKTVRPAQYTLTETMAKEQLSPFLEA